MKTNQDNFTAGTLTNSEVVQFKKLVKKFMKIKLSETEAEEQGARLIRVFELILRDPQRYN